MSLRYVFLSSMVIWIIECCLFMRWHFLFFIIAYLPFLFQVPCILSHIRLKPYGIAEAVPIPDVKDSCSHIGRCCRSHGIGGGSYFSSMVPFSQKERVKNFRDRIF